ncbi:hypothetical protein BXZ70DRAFT_141610 [Cristinia sonorae]|uniref:Uncharacterized protein n=1 Tax=Cristinia sonorae TaxID=1940300 RepID=A0A8K0UP39_9AGAR|nr:hypothetical protein BXZ70DRAFT_141610 [Cristinia sonorae]
MNICKHKEAVNICSAFNRRLARETCEIFQIKAVFKLRTSARGFESLITPPPMDSNFKESLTIGIPIQATSSSWRKHTLPVYLHHTLVKSIVKQGRLSTCTTVTFRRSLQPPESGLACSGRLETLPICHLYETNSTIWRCPQSRCLAFPLWQLFHNENNLRSATIIIRFNEVAAFVMHGDSFVQSLDSTSHRGYVHDLSLASYRRGFAITSFAVTRAVVHLSLFFCIATMSLFVCTFKALAL